MVFSKVVFMGFSYKDKFEIVIQMAMSIFMKKYK